MGWFGGTIIFGNTHILNIDSVLSFTHFFLDNEYNNLQELEVKKSIQIVISIFAHTFFGSVFKPKVLWTKRVQGDRWNKIKEPLKPPVMHRPAPRASLNANPRGTNKKWISSVMDGYQSLPVFTGKSKDKFFGIFLVKMVNDLFPESFLSLWGAGIFRGIWGDRHRDHYD